ncbi:MAG: TIGR01212 family radical SAM protein [Deltaproteobacteria bacterium RBG_16_64_85]|nr:MAG: TIGR01212 family radical SAM protein [Deltaproteobacteria bacterium RBG_16_64_85]
MFPPIHPELRFHNYASFLRRRLGGPAARISVEAGFTCPNRDGTRGTGGCLYCNNESFTEGVLFPGLPVEEQVRRTIASHARLKAFRKLLVYFQPYTNSHAPPEELERTYRAAFCHPDVVGIVVGTRPDCLGSAVLDVLEGIARERYVSVEIGLQSISDDVLAGINRGHTVQEFMEAVPAARKRGIDVAVHLIYGLPGDTRVNFVAAAGILSDLGVQGVKLHHLHVVSGSNLESPFRRGEVRVPEYGEYVGACADFLERLCPEIAVIRLIGTAPREMLLAPLWGKGSREMSRDVAAELQRRETWQGSLRKEKT